MRATPIINGTNTRNQFPSRVEDEEVLSRHTIIDIGDAVRWVHLGLEDGDGGECPIGPGDGYIDVTVSSSNPGVLRATPVVPETEFNTNFNILENAEYDDGMGGTTFIKINSANTVRLDPSFRGGSGDIVSSYFFYEGVSAGKVALRFRAQVVYSSTLTPAERAEKQVDRIDFPDLNERNELEMRVRGNVPAVELRAETIDEMEFGGGLTAFNHTELTEGESFIVVASLSIPFVLEGKGISLPFDRDVTIPIEILRSIPVLDAEGVQLENSDGDSPLPP